MRAFHIRTALIVTLLILAPFLVHRVYRRFTALPDTITFATGPINGQWHALSHNLIRSIESKCNVDVETFSDATEGSVQHLELLERQQVDFALYLRGSRRLQAADAPPPVPAPMIVGNLYSDFTLFLVRQELYRSGQLRTPAELDDKKGGKTPCRVAVGRPLTGEYTVAQSILEYYFGNEREVFEELLWDYEQLEAGFAKEELDAAFITAGHQAPIFKRLIESGLCVLGEIPHVDAIAMKSVGLRKVSVPEGLFRCGNRYVPNHTVDTLASRTMLLTREEVPSQMVEEVAKILLSEDFIHDNQLFELSQQGVAFACDNPEFTIHPGALNVYEPGLEPLVDPEFMDATENFRSFGVSLLIGVFLVYQWYSRQRERRMDHRLDEYFSELLAIDSTSCDSEHHTDTLQESLDRVIGLRNEALGEFSARDFDEDRAADSFIQLCDTVADGFRSKLLRAQLQQGFRQLAREWNPCSERSTEHR